jgi:hypothetical protein
MDGPPLLLKAQRMADIVCVVARNPFGPSLRHSVSQNFHETQMIQANNPNPAVPIRCKDFRRGICTPIIEREEFEIAECLSENPIDGFPQVFLSIPDGHYDGDLG